VVDAACSAQVAGQAGDAVWNGLFMAILMAASVPLNAWNYRDRVPSSLGHLLPVAAFFGCMLAGKGAVMSLRGGKVRADRISAGEWAAHPLRSLSLWRWMTTWGEPSREKALTRYMVLLFAVAIAQADDNVGRAPFVWRRRLPVTLRYQLDTGTFPASVAVAIAAGDWQQAVEDWVTAALTATRPAPKVRQARAAIGRDTAPPDATPGAAASATPDATPGEDPGDVPQRQRRDKPPADWRNKAAGFVSRNGGIDAVRASRIRAADVAEEAGTSKRTAERFLADLLKRAGDSGTAPRALIALHRAAGEG